jgi:hypothetical protein
VWCERTKFSINPNKTAVIPFTKKRTIKEPILFNKMIQVCSEVKCLGITIDKGLTWKKQLDKIITRPIRLSGHAEVRLGKLGDWIYTVTVRPIVTYAATIWWHTVQHKISQAKVSKLQRMVCLEITGAMTTVPTAVMEALLGLPPLHLQVGTIRIETSILYHTVKLQSKQAVWDCHQSLIQLARHNRVQLIWVPGHEDNADNETAGLLERTASEHPSTGPELTCGISIGVAKRAVRDWMNRNHIKQWEFTTGLKQAKGLISGPSARKTEDLLKLNRQIKTDGRTIHRTLSSRGTPFRTGIDG